MSKIEHALEKMTRKCREMEERSEAIRGSSSGGHSQEGRMTQV